MLDETEMNDPIAREIRALRHVIARAAAADLGLRVAH